MEHFTVILKQPFIFQRICVAVWGTVVNFGETTKNQVLTKIEFCFFSLKNTFIPQHTYTLPNRHVNVLNLS